MNNVWNYHDKQLKKLKQIYNRTSKQTQNNLQDIFDSCKIDFEHLYSITGNKTLNRIKTKIEEWKDKGLLNGYFGMLANNIYKKTRVKNSEILELLIYGAYIEEQSKLEKTELNIFKDVANYYYQEGQNEVNQTLPKKKRKLVSVIPDAIFLALLDMQNEKGYVWKQYVEAIIKYNADQIYRQMLINIQQNKENNIDDSVYQNIITKQQNAKLSINQDKISGAVDNELLGLNNLAKVEGIKSIAEDNSKVRFIATIDGKETDMCHSLDGQTFYINKENEFDRYYGETQKDLRIERIKCFGLVVGLNLPPISHHFHYCRSTITYQIDMPREELNKMLNMEYRDITNRILNRDKKEYKVEEQNYYKDDNGSKYEVDGKYVIMKPTKNEKQVANLLGELYGGKVKIIPRINVPENIKTPDYMIGNKKYDLKEIKGNGKYVIQGNLKGKSQQADNFVIDISKSKIQEIDAIEQIQSIYKSKHYLWIDELILIKNNQILKIYKRK